MGSILLMLVGGLLAAGGALMLVVGLTSVAAGQAFGHAGGVLILAYAVPLVAIGLWACKRGRRAYEQHIG